MNLKGIGGLLALARLIMYVLLMLMLMLNMEVRMCVRVAQKVTEAKGDAGLGEKKKGGGGNPSTAVQSSPVRDTTCI